MSIRGRVLAGVLVLTAAVGSADNGWGPIASYWDCGDWGDDVSPGLRIALELRPGVLLDLRYTALSSQYGRVAGRRTSVDDDIVEVGIAALRATRRCDLYAGGGIGYHMIDGWVEGVRSDAADLYDDAWGLYGVLGVDAPICDRIPSINAQRVTVFAEVLYRYVSLEEADTGVRLSGAPDNMDGPGAAVGLLLRW